MSTLYTQCESFASFVQSLVALGYLPPSEVLVAMSELEQFQFDPEIPKDDMEKIEKFKSSILQYTYDTWIDGDFHPEVWNYWMHTSGNTNNVNEGWNSGFGETVGQSHPNLHILSDFLSRELKKSMNDADILASGGLVRPASTKYVALANRRMKLMNSYATGEVSRHDYLITMGLLSWKQSHEGRKISRNTEAPQQEAPNQRGRGGGRGRGGRGRGLAHLTPALQTQAQLEEEDLNDETRVQETPVLSDNSDAEADPDLFPQRRIRALRIAPAHEARRGRDKCAKCAKGFVKSMNTWLKCTGTCGLYFHKRCLTDDKFREPFICFTCHPDAVLAPGNIYAFLFLKYLSNF